jgi:hypothetical protein
VRRSKATPILELERYTRSKDSSEVRGYPYKRSHPVGLRATKITACDPPSTSWPASGELDQWASREKAKPVVSATVGLLQWVITSLWTLATVFNRDHTSFRTIDTLRGGQISMRWLCSEGLIWSKDKEYGQRNQRSSYQHGEPVKH